MLTAAPKTLCREIFLSAPYSTIVPKKPALWGPSTVVGMFPPGHMPIRESCMKTAPTGADITVLPWVMAALGPLVLSSSRPSQGWLHSSKFHHAARGNQEHHRCDDDKQVLTTAPPRQSSTAD